MVSQPLVSDWLTPMGSHYSARALGMCRTRLHSIHLHRSAPRMFPSAFRLIMCLLWGTIASMHSTAAVLDQFHLARLSERNCDAIWPNQSLEPTAGRCKVHL